ncbi:hypothetical protein CI238_11438, partial [Colletotrichum incanum]
LWSRLSPVTMRTKSLAVLGQNEAGRKTLIGRLIHMFGLSLTQVSELNDNGCKSHGEIASFLENNQIAPLFYGPSNRFNVEVITDPDVALWVVAATDADNGNASRDELASLISNKQRQPKELLSFGDLDSNTVSGRHLDDPPLAYCRTVCMVPVSALNGGNILESPPKSTRAQGLPTVHDVGRPGIISNPTLMNLFREDPAIDRPLGTLPAKD